MRVKNCLLVTLTAAVIVLASMGLMLAADGARLILYRPGCGEPDGSIECVNTDPTKFYKVTIEGGIAGGPGHVQCSNNAECKGVFAYPSSELTVTPCGYKDMDLWCASAEASLTSCTHCFEGTGNCELVSCDNVRGTNNCSGTNCQPTCGDTSREFCSTVGNVRVTLTASSVNGTTWTSLGQVVCASGSYATTCVPTCYSESYCATHSAPRAACAGLQTIWCTYSEQRPGS